MFVNVKDEVRSTKLRVPIEDDFSLSIDTLRHYFPGPNTTLKCMDEDVIEWTGLPMKNNRLWFNRGSWNPDRQYIAFRPEEVGSTQPPPPPTTTTRRGTIESLERDTDTPPIRAKRNCGQYLSLVFVVIFGCQTAILLSVLYRRQNRRGKLVFLGCKADCFTFYYGTVDNDGYAELSTYRWSCPPGLYEKADEIRQAIQDAHKAIGTIEK